MKRKREQMEERKEPKDSSNNKNRRERKKMLCYTVYVNALVFVTYKNIIKTDREGEGEQREGEDRDRRENEREYHCTIYGHERSSMFVPRHSTTIQIDTFSFFFRGA